MPIKLREFLKGTADKIGLKDADFESVLAASALNEIELPDSFSNSFNQGYLTRDSAKNDPAIVSEIQKATNRTAFNAFDEKANGFLSMLDPEDQEKVKNTKETYEKYDLIRAGLKKILSTKGGKATAEEIQKIESEWSEKLKQASSIHKAEVEKLRLDFDNEMVSNMIKQKALAFNFAEPFGALKESISEITVNKLRSQYNLVLKEGSLSVMRDVDGTLREVYENNEKVTVDSLLQKELSKFVAVSQKEKKDDDDGKGKKRVDTSGMTLAEMRKANL